MSFKESFERSGEKENLDYDDSAFYYFGLAMLNVVLIPITYQLIIKPMVWGEFTINRHLKNCQCMIC
jgi:preprotein translocase subunit Sec63